MGKKYSGSGFPQIPRDFVDDITYVEKAFQKATMELHKDDD